MKYTKDTQNRFLIYGLLLTLLFSGCISSLKKSYPKIDSYSLQIEEFEHPPFEGKPVSVQINKLVASPAIDGKFLMYRTGETAYESDFYNQWLAAPVQILQDNLQNGLSKSPLIEYVTEPFQDLKADYAVDGKLTQLFGDYRDEKKPQAVMSLELTLSDIRKGAPKFVAQKTYQKAVPLDRISTELLVAGWNQGLKDIVQDFEKDFKGIIQNTELQK
jgi:ABC-type uncharacterized transport system auxiliary subunit